MQQQDIQAIVDEVVRRLLADHDLQPSADGNETVITGRVITMDCLEGKLENTCQLVVCERAVVTPLVVDFLKENKITLTRRPLAG
jgi:hypothetical protein